MRRHHIESVTATLDGHPTDIKAAVVNSSWHRSAAIHRVDPASKAPPVVLESQAVRQAREPIENAVLAAQPELDRLQNIVADAGYVTLFCDAAGVAVDHRGNEERAAEFRKWGIWLGGVWSESAEGTNGIGTCIAEHRPVSIHQTQHFRTRHIGLSCSGAPVFDPDSNLIAVLDVSSIAAGAPAESHVLTLPLVIDSARMIEERLFRERFRSEWIVAVAPDGDEPAALLAVNQDHYVIGANRRARVRFNLDPQAVARGTSVSALFTTGTTLLQRGMRRDYPVRLRAARDGDMLFALVSNPLLGKRSQLGYVETTLATQPRRTLLNSLRRHVMVNPDRGGLPPNTVRHMRKYVADHLGDALSIESLARQAGLSIHHFARAFRESFGMPPHRYLLEQRVHKAAELLEQTDQLVTSIALALGFADQSHFCRTFQRLMGLTPRQYRRAHR
jgi:transcriptional regulator of acetoin/glycerol metabolism